MNSPAACFGIESFGYSLGEKQSVELTAKNYVKDPDRVLEWGCHTYYRAPEDVYAVDLAVEAAKKAIENGNIDIENIGLVVFATAEIPEYLYWDSASAFSNALGIEKTQTMFLNNEGCSVGIKCLQHIAGSFAIQPELETVLLVVVNRVSEYHRNRMEIVNCVFSDGAVATILQRGSTKNQWLATECFTYPEYSNLFRVDYGGAKFPTAPEGWSNTDIPAYIEVNNHFKGNLELQQRFMVKRNELVIEAVEGACARANISTKKLSHLIYINDSRVGAIESIAQTLGISLDKTNFELSKSYGHMGAVDQLVSLGLLIETGEINPGDIVALCGISTGMQWSASLIRS